MRRLIFVIAGCLFFLLNSAKGQVTKFEKYEIEAVGVSMSRVTIMGKEAIKVIKDATIRAVDEPTFIKLNAVDFSDGTIEVKVLSKLLKNAPETARGFIGLAFHINSDNTRFESIYIRPLNARADDQVRRNHSIQYFAYPDFKFDRLRKEVPERYESYSDMQMNKWITLKIEVDGANARLFIDKNLQPSLVVNDLKLGAKSRGAIGLWVDIGTEGYFADLKIIPRK
ncbi:MAG: hypothetical protein EOP48_13820 [Sphingobacteriales bacterium]|nr:MAG: hypothetical protein EOP48_13820 [Sphingobacteriales bacterium]